MRESDLDGDQDLTFWLRSLEDVLREILGDERMDGHQVAAVLLQLAAVGCCSNTNSCWKTWLGQVRLATFNWIELEWQRP
jgi:hypothetical protein